jgi:hypothetical protein
MEEFFFAHPIFTIFLWAMLIGLLDGGLIAILAIVFNKIMDYLGIYSIKDCGKKS